MNKRTTRKTILIASISVLLIGGFLVNKYWLNQPDIPLGETIPKSNSKAEGRNKAIPVTVATVHTEQVLDGIRAVGSLVPNEEVELASETSGKVESVLFKEGATVRKGEVLIKVNDDDLQAQLKRLDFQKKTLGEKLERQRILFAKEAVSRENFDQVQTEYNMLLAEIEALNVKISRASIKAPFSGVIGFRYVSEGSYLQPNTKIAKLVDYNTLKLEFSIPEKYVGLPLSGKKIYFQTENNTKRYEASIYAAEPKVDQATRTIMLRALFDNARAELRPGMTIRVTIPTSEAADILMIPTEAVIPSAEGKSVWLVQNGKPISQPIETGVRLEKDIEVLKGLQQGDSVIITGIMQMRDGANIVIKN